MTLPYPAVRPVRRVDAPGPPPTREAERLTPGLRTRHAGGTFSGNITFRLQAFPKTWGLKHQEKQNEHPSNFERI